MQNRYVGDIGDFAKFGMLRFICKSTGLRLGINWYLVPDETGNNDGRHTTYLLNDPLKMRKLDPDLFDQLKSIVETNQRNVREIEKRNLFHQSTLFHNSLLSYKDIPVNQREGHRKKWELEACSALTEAEILFIDPDNGLETPSCSIRRTRAPKYAFYSEIQRLWQSGKSLVLYSHKTREPDELYFKRITKLFNIDESIKSIFHLRSHRGTVRDFVFLLQNCHKDLVTNAVCEMLVHGWEDNVFTFHEHNKD